jgi:hypothetical protein
LINQVLSNFLDADVLDALGSDGPNLVLGLQPIIEIEAQLLPSPEIQLLGAITNPRFAVGHGPFCRAP